MAAGVGHNSKIGYGGELALITWLPRMQSTAMMNAALTWITQLVSALSLVDVGCVIGAVAIIRMSRYAGMWIYALVALPGTLAHELAHFVVAFVLGAQPSLPSMRPIRTEHGWRLGSVAFRVGYARALPIALAPLLLAPLALWWAGSLLHPAFWPLYGLHVWIVAALLTASFPSATDFRLALPALTVIAVLAALIWFVANYG